MKATSRNDDATKTRCGICRILFLLAQMLTLGMVIYLMVIVPRINSRLIAEDARLRKIISKNYALQSDVNFNLTTQDQKHAQMIADNSKLGKVMAQQMVAEQLQQNAKPTISIAFTMVFSCKLSELVRCVECQKVVSQGIANTLSDELGGAVTEADVVLKSINGGGMDGTSHRVLLEEAQGHVGVYVSRPSYEGVDTFVNQSQLISGDVYRDYINKAVMECKTCDKAFSVKSIKGIQSRLSNTGKSAECDVILNSKSLLCVANTSTEDTRLLTDCSDDQKNKILESMNNAKESTIVDMEKKYCGRHKDKVFFMAVGNLYMTKYAFTALNQKIVKRALMAKAEQTQLEDQKANAALVQTFVDLAVMVGTAALVAATGGLMAAAAPALAFIMSKIKPDKMATLVKSVEEVAIGAVKGGVEALAKESSSISKALVKPISKFDAFKMGWLKDIPFSKTPTIPPKNLWLLNAQGIAELVDNQGYSSTLSKFGKVGETISLKKGLDGAFKYGLDKAAKKINPHENKLGEQWLNTAQGTKQGINGAISAMSENYLSSGSSKEEARVQVSIDLTVSEMFRKMLKVFDSYHKMDDDLQRIQFLSWVYFIEQEGEMERVMRELSYKMSLLNDVGVNKHIFVIKIVDIPETAVSRCEDDGGLFEPDKHFKYHEENKVKAHPYLQQISDGKQGLCNFKKCDRTQCKSDFKEGNYYSYAKVFDVTVFSSTSSVEVAADEQEYTKSWSTGKPQLLFIEWVDPAVYPGELVNATFNIFRTTMLPPENNPSLKRRTFTSASEPSPSGGYITRNKLTIKQLPEPGKTTGEHLFDGPPNPFRRLKNEEAWDRFKKEASEMTAEKDYEYQELRGTESNAKFLEWKFDEVCGLQTAETRPEHCKSANYVLKQGEPCGETKKDNQCATQSCGRVNQFDTDEKDKNAMYRCCPCKTCTRRFDTFKDYCTDLPVDAECDGVGDESQSHEQCKSGHCAPQVAIAGKRWWSHTYDQATSTHRYKFKKLDSNYLQKPEDAVQTKKDFSINKERDFYKSSTGKTVYICKERPGNQQYCSDDSDCSSHTCAHTSNQGTNNLLQCCTSESWFYNWDTWTWCTNQPEGFPCKHDAQCKKDGDDSYECKEPEDNIGMKITTCHKK